MNYTIVPLTAQHYQLLREMLYQSIYVPQGTASPPFNIIDKPELHRYIVDWGRATDYGLCAVSAPPADAHKTRGVNTQPSTLSANTSVAINERNASLTDTANPTIKLGAVWLRYFSATTPGYGFIDENVPELGMAVAEPYRGRGIGTVLLQQLIANTSHIPSISLSVHKDNRAILLYERCGFYQYATTDDDSLIMRYDREQ